MFKRNRLGMIIAGACAGTVAGLFGAGGGLVLVPLLTLLTGIEESSVFSSSLSIILPICVVCLTVTLLTGSVALQPALPYLLGSAVGGVCAGVWGHRIPVIWLHRGLGLLILWGGYRYLC
ncbi:MAG: TSUP family transporter [Faecousia sp.]